MKIAEMLEEWHSRTGDIPRGADVAQLRLDLIEEETGETADELEAFDGGYGKLAKLAKELLISSMLPTDAPANLTFLWTIA